MKSWTAKCGDAVLCITTNLDLHRAESLPAVFHSVPRVGELIRSTTRWKQPPIEFVNAPPMSSPPFQLELEVVRVIHTETGVEVEVTLPNRRWESLRDFHNFYGRVTGGTYI